MRFPKNSLRLLFALIYYLATASVALPQMNPNVPKPQSPFANRVLEGTRMLQKREYDGALRAFQDLLEAAKRSGNKEWEGDCYFYLGLTRQQQAEARGWGTETVSLAKEAEAFYEAALRIRPDSAPILNNLAQVYLRTGRKDRAAGLMNKAILLGGKQQPFYTMNYAEYLAGSGDWRGARDNYGKVLEAQPENLEAHNRLVKLDLGHDQTHLADYLWEIVKKGQVLRAQKTVVNILSEGTWKGAKEELIAIVAASLSKQYYEPAGYSQMDIAAQLEKVGRDPSIGLGVAELRHLHEGGMDPSRYPWWGKRAVDSRDPPRGIWPRDAFRQLIRSLGNWYEKGDPGLAEQYYLLSANLSETEIDPTALLALADLYVTQERKADLDRLAREYVFRLFTGKGRAYRHSQVDRIFEFHRALGVIYGYLEQWGASDVPTSAVFQLEHAREIARRRRGEDLVFEPRLVALLAMAYERKSPPEPERSVQLRLEFAESYLQQKKERDAAEILKPLDPNRLPAAISDADRAKLVRLRFEAKLDRPHLP